MSAAAGRASNSSSATGHGAACTRRLETAQRHDRGAGHSVARNAPYAGGFTPVTTDGRAMAATGADRDHRSLYMDERTSAAKPFLAGLPRTCATSLPRSAAIDPALVLRCARQAE